jgi:hypothetical protein
MPGVPWIRIVCFDPKVLAADRICRKFRFGTVAALSTEEAEVSFMVEVSGKRVEERVG